MAASLRRRVERETRPIRLVTPAHAIPRVCGRGARRRNYLAMACGALNQFLRLRKPPATRSTNLWRACVPPLQELGAVPLQGHPMGLHSKRPGVLAGSPTIPGFEDVKQ